MPSTRRPVGYNQVRQSPSTASPDPPLTSLSRCHENCVKESLPTPPPDLEDEVVLEEIHGLLARAIRGSNSIEGYHVEVDDAAAALDDEEPLSADQTTFTEIRGYRQALGYVLGMSSDPHSTLDASAIRSMHYMMLSHDLSKSPGRYRTGAVYVHDEAPARPCTKPPTPPQYPDSSKNWLPT
jgi:hypothetical protein